MVTSRTYDEINSELRSANKSPKSRDQKIKFSLKQQAFQHPVQKEHLSIQLLENIQTILFMVICCHAPSDLSVCTV